LSLSFAAYALPSYYAETDPSQGEYLRRLVDLLATAEPLGYDAVWLNEHHFTPWGGLLSSPPTVLAALSQRTKRLRLGTSVSVVALHHPIELAEQLATLDLLSGGRLDVGIGRGSAPFDHEVFGVPYSDAQARTLEGLEVMLQAWRGEPFAHTGEHFTLPRVEVWPAAQQQPHPPIWFSCSSSPESFQWTARHAYNLLTIAFAKPVPKFAELTRAYREAWSGPPDGYRITTLYQAVVRERGDEARDLAMAAIRRYLGQMQQSLTLSSVPRRNVVEDLVIERMIQDQRLLAGTPDEVAATLACLQDQIGFTQVALQFQFGGLTADQASESMHLLAQGFG
jgi:alkanesulfonate monooxygenase SsuD/methylene tetrahydromethanopterin reductase-like flavin-dependent oxidoreductase (luciferase family)